MFLFSRKGISDLLSSNSDSKIGFTNGAGIWGLGSEWTKIEKCEKMKKYTPQQNDNFYNKKFRPWFCFNFTVFSSCSFIFPIVFLYFPRQTLRKSRPWSNFTGFLLYCWGVNQSEQNTPAFQSMLESWCSCDDVEAREQSCGQYQEVPIHEPKVFIIISKAILSILLPY